jgi:hypothetical protein
MPGPGRYTPKEDRQAGHVADSMQKAHPGMSHENAESIGYATVEKEKGEKGGGKAEERAESQPPRHNGPNMPAPSSSKTNKWGQ